MRQSSLGALKATAGELLSFPARHDQVRGGSAAMMANAAGRPESCSPKMSVGCKCRYGAEQGRGDLREALCRTYYQQHGRTADEIFVSDGSKCDIGRLQVGTRLAAPADCCVKG